GYLAFKPDDKAPKAAPETHRASPAGLAKLPADGWIFTYMDVDAQTFEKFQAMGMNMLQQGGKASPALKKAKAKLHGIGRIESVGAVMNIGMTAITELFVPDPAAYIDACVATAQAMQEGGDGQPGLYKDVKIERDAQTADGLKFTQVSFKMDTEQMQKLVGNAPGQAEMMKAMLGKGDLSQWYGTDGKRLIQIGARSWDEARKMLDSFTNAGGGVGRTAGFKAATSELPERANLVVVFNVQSYL